MSDDKQKFIARRLIIKFSFPLIFFLFQIHLYGFYLPEYAERADTTVRSVADAVKMENVKIAEIKPFPSGVQGMTMNDEGVLYFSDTYSRLDDVSRVYALSPPYSGEPIPTEISGRSIAGLLWHDEKLYVSFLNKNEIIIYDRELNFLESRFIESPWGFATDGKYVFVTTYYGDIGLITNTRVKFFIEKIGFPFDMAFSGNESLWISERASIDSTGRIFEIGYEGTIIRDLKTGMLNPHGLELGEDNSLYVADKDAGVIYQIPEVGNPVIVTKDYSAPICIIKDQMGRLLVNTDHNGGMLLVIKLPGE